MSALRKEHNGENRLSKTSQSWFSAQWYTRGLGYMNVYVLATSEMKRNGK